MQAINTHTKPLLASSLLFLKLCILPYQHVTDLASRCLLQALLCFVHKVLLFEVQVAFELDQGLKEQKTTTSEGNQNNCYL